MAVGGALLGNPLAYAGLNAIIALVPPDTIPDESEIVINAAVLAFTVGISMATAGDLRPRAGVAGLVHRSHRVAEGRRAVGDRRQAPGHHEQRSGHRGGDDVGDAAGGRGADDADAGGDARRWYWGVEPEALQWPYRCPLVETRYPDATRRVRFFQSLLARLETAPGVRGAAWHVRSPPVCRMDDPDRGARQRQPGHAAGRVSPGERPVHPHHGHTTAGRARPRGW